MEEMQCSSSLADGLFRTEHMAAYLEEYCRRHDMTQSLRALAFASEKHAGQTRDLGPGHGAEPYICHPLLLACQALAMGLEDDALIAACLLHDVCEDCGVRGGELPVGDEAREIVRLLTKWEGFSKTERDERAYYDAIARNGKACLVKLLDRCNNISSAAIGFSDQRLTAYMRETETYLFPLFDVIRRLCPEYERQVFLLNYHMASVMEALRRYEHTLAGA